MSPEDTERGDVRTSWQDGAKSQIREHLERLGIPFEEEVSLYQGENSHRENYFSRADFGIIHQNRLTQIIEVEEAPEPKKVAGDFLATCACSHWAAKEKQGAISAKTLLMVWGGIQQTGSKKQENLDAFVRWLNESIRIDKMSSVKEIRLMLLGQFLKESAGGLTDGR